MEDNKLIKSTESRARSGEKAKRKKNRQRESKAAHRAKTKVER